MGNKARDAIILTIVLVIGIGGVVGVGFYQDEVKGFILLEGWNRGQIESLTMKFMDACSKNDGTAVKAMLANDEPELKTKEAGGKTTHIITPDYGGPVTRPLATMARPESGKIKDIEYVWVNGGSVRVQVNYAGSHGVGLRWKKKPAGWRVTEVTWVQTEAP